MWTTARYAFTSLFSLRPALATSSGAQTLLVPTPFAIKMALASATAHVFGAGSAAELWPAIRDLSIALHLPDTVVVNKTFIKVQRPTRFSKGNAEEVAAVKERGHYPFNPTIAFREFVQFGDELGVALGEAGQHPVLPLADLYRQINYLGKRGGFVQLQAPPEHHYTLGTGWTLITEPSTQIDLDGTLQLLDDCGQHLSWEHVNVYSNKSIKLNATERVLRPIVLPYAQERSSYRYTVYRLLREV